MGKKKLTVAFNEQDRREYLLGFRKRKDARRTVAKQKIEKRLQEERRALREERRKHHGPVHIIPQDVDDLVSTVKEETIDLPTHSVTITKMEDLELAQEDLFLGRNHFFMQSATHDAKGDEGEDITQSGAKRRGSSKNQVDTGREADPKKLKSLEKMMAKLKKSNRSSGRGRGAQNSGKSDAPKGSKSRKKQ